MTDPNLVTTCNFHGQEFLFKMNVLHNNLDILITDKNSGEEWQCSYDATYVENLTHKTGNFKQFEIFVTMIKSGLLRTSECVTLDLLTYDDLEALRSRKITKACASNNSNRRYLIVTYCVEFDKIRYPLPLEYCGPPDPVILQGTIRRLELELARTKEELALKANNSDSRKIYFLQKRVDELTEENIQLQEEIRLLTRQHQLGGKTKPKSQITILQKAVDKLEKSVISERSSRHELVQKLKNDNVELSKQLEKIRQSERNLKARLRRTVSQSPARMEYGVGDYETDKDVPIRKKSNQSLKTMYRNKSPYVQKTARYWDCPSKQRANPLSQSSSSSSAKYMDVECHEPSASPLRSPCRSKPSSPGAHSRSSSVGSRGSSKASARARPKRAASKASDLDFAKLEKKIESLHKILKMNAQK